MSRYHRASAAAGAAPGRWYHGTSAPDFRRFRPGEAYLTDDPGDAAGFARGRHLGGARGGEPRVVEVSLAPGPVADADAEVASIVADEHPDLGDIEGLMARLRAEGWRYADFTHPGFAGGDIRVRVSLHPEEDPGLPGRGASAARPPGMERALASRGVRGDDLLDALDLADELAAAGAEVSPGGIVTLYHRTDPASAEEIVRSGRMLSREDRVFFGTSPAGQIEGHGDAAVRVRMPLERLGLEAVMPGEAFVSVKSGGRPVRVDAEPALEAGPPRPGAARRAAGTPDIESDIAEIAADVRRRLIGGHGLEGDPPTALCLDFARELVGELARRGYAAGVTQGKFEVDWPDEQNYDDWDPDDFEGDPDDDGGEFAQAAHFPLHYWVRVIAKDGEPIVPVFADITADQFDDESDEPFDPVWVWTGETDRHLPERHDFGATAPRGRSATADGAVSGMIAAARRRYGDRLFGGNCGQFALGLARFIKDSGLRPDPMIAIVTDADVDTEDDLRDGEPDVYHAYLQLGQAYYDGGGRVSRQGMLDFAAGEYGDEYPILWDDMPPDEDTRRIISANTNWSIEWTDFYRFLESAAAEGRAGRGATRYHRAIRMLAHAGERVYHGTTLSQLEAIRDSGWRARGLYLADHREKSEDYASMRAESESPDAVPVVLQLDMAALRRAGQVEIDRGSGPEEREHDMGQFVYSGPLRDAITNLDEVIRELRDEWGEEFTP